ncbi:MAG: hypothetical protein PUH53_05870 [Mycoplasma sp.]|nr:hypothetical protein [Mycoplasma sp.]
MNKKIKIGLFVFIIIGVVILNFMYKNEETKTKKKKQSNLAIMIKGDSGEYVNSDTIPKGNYVLNEEKTVCENGGKVVSYNNSTGQIGFSFLGSDRCSLYFDKIIDTQKPAISNLNVNGKTITATLTDNEGLSAYGFSTSNTIEPTSWTTISGKTYNLSTTINNEGTYYLWVKDSVGNKTTKEFTISLETSFATLMSTSTPDVYNENGLRYEGADPKNYICLDNKTSGACADSSLLFRIIGLFDEEYSSNGTSSSGTKKLLKVIDTNNYGGTSGKYWNSAKTNNWSNASLKTELNGTYLTTLLGTLNVNSKLNTAIVSAKWHLGGASSSNYDTLTAEGIYIEERNTSAIVSGNPAIIYAKVGLMYPSDYGYATVGGITTNKAGCRAQALNNWNSSSYSDCKNNDWVFTSATFVNTAEWLLSPSSSNSHVATRLYTAGYVGLGGGNFVHGSLCAVRPTFYLDSSILKIVGTGDGSSSNPYRIG